jgi:Domain of unknown function (DUF2017)
VADDDLPDGGDDWEEDEDYERAFMQRMIRQESRVPRWFAPLADGTFEVRLAEPVRQMVQRIATDLRDLLLAGDDSLHRLYPTAYPDDPDRNAEFAAFAHDQLLMARLEALDVVEATADRDELTADQLSAWMQVVNEARLVLGTRLDVTEDDDRDDDPDHPDAPGLALYHRLGILLDDIVRALYGKLPPPTQPDD